MQPLSTSPLEEIIPQGDIREALLEALSIKMYPGREADDCAESFEDVEAGLTETYGEIFTSGNVAIVHDTHGRNTLVRSIPELFKCIGYNIGYVVSGSEEVFTDAKEETGKIIQPTPRQQVSHL